MGRQSGPIRRWPVEGLTVGQFLIKYIVVEPRDNRKGGVRGRANSDCG